MAIKQVNIPTMLAAALFAATAGIHAFLGGPEINLPVQNSGLDPVVRAVMAVVWHALTGLFLLLAVALAWAATQRNRALLLLALAICVTFALIFLTIGTAELGNIALMPQWTIFAAISLCILWALKRERELGW